MENKATWFNTEVENWQVVYNKEQEALQKRLENQDEDEETLNLMSDLAMTCRMLEKWKEAEELEMKVWKGRTELLGENHPDTLASQATLTQQRSFLDKHK